MARPGEGLRRRSTSWCITTGRCRWRRYGARGGLVRAALSQAQEHSKAKTMQQITAIESNMATMPRGVTPITDIKNQKRASKTLSKAVGLHLEGKLEPAARLLIKA